MITEEEKKAIDKLNRQITIGKCENNIGIPVYISSLEIILNLITKLQADIEIKDKVIEEIKSKLQKHINFCEQESRGHLENKVCHISLKFEKRLLKEIKKAEEENE